MCNETYYHKNEIVKRMLNIKQNQPSQNQIAQRNAKVK